MSSEEQVPVSPVAASDLRPDSFVIGPQQLFTALFTLCGGALAFWIACFSLSSYLGHPREAAKTVERGNTQKELSPELKKLELAAAQPNAKTETILDFAEALMADGFKSGDAGTLMRAVQNFTRVLDTDNANARALLGLAHVSFESGVLDKAKEYYERYLSVAPEDLKAATDLALVHLQLGDTDVALKSLEKLSLENPKFFPARLSLALTLKVSGDKEAAKKTAEQALALAADDGGRQVVTQFLANIDKPELPDVPEAPEAPSSPAMAVDQYFRNHPILGPKLDAINWVSADTVEVSLKEFPMDKMPDFAREKFVGSLKKLLADIGSPVSLRLKDAASGKVIFELPAAAPAK